jgi:hypothetical protein
VIVLPNGYFGDAGILRLTDRLAAFKDSLISPQ